MKGYFAYWGKAGGSPGPSHNLLVFHCLDSAAVALALLEADPVLASRLAGGLGLSPGAAARLAAFCIGLHDAGKFALSFQSLVPELLARLQPGVPPSPLPGGHQLPGLAAWRHILVRAWFDEGWLGLDQAGGRDAEKKRLLNILYPAVAGHHGQPLESGDLARIAKRDFKGDYRRCLLAFARDLAQVVGGRDLLAAWGELPSPRRLKTTSWLLAGLCVAADWLASNPDYFPFHTQPVPLAERWPLSLELAREAVAKSGMASARPAAFGGFAPLFDGRAPRPLQALAEEVAIGQGPQLFILEDATGSGKTEAALTLAARLMAAGRAEGFYVALPTMATANAMYKRLSRMYQRLFQAGGRPSLALAHSQRHLVDEFSRSIELAARRPETSLEGDVEASGAACAAWLAQGNKRALLAQVGVGTLDQALSAVLPARHQCLKLLGLCRGVLLADEIHAYDPHMTQLLAGLLRFQAALGGSAVLLSATLPLEIRKHLVEAFQKGLDTGKGPAPVSMAYPLLTRLDARGLEEIPVAPAPGQDREVRISLAHEPAQVVRRLCEVARKGGGGGCACWVRNTVDDAMEAYEELVAELGRDRVMLFHARLALKDRLSVEDEVLKLFGPESTPADRAGRVLVATQVVEQSLDLDFDFMATDLAPMDLIIQRAGRLHRHLRPQRPVNEPELLVLAPPLEAEPAKDWYARFFPRGCWVYGHHGQLWLTCRLLAQRGALRLPAESRELVEGVFGAEAQEAIPLALKDTEGRQVGKDYADRSCAQGKLLRPNLPYGGQGKSWGEDVETRLGAESVTLRLARWEDGRLTPWAKDADPHLAWDLSQVSVRPGKAAEEAVPSDPALARAMEDAKAAMRDQCRWAKLVPLVPGENGRWHGEVLDSQGRTRQVVYHQRLGLV